MRRHGALKCPNAKPVGARGQRGARSSGRCVAAPASWGVEDFEAYRPPEFSLASVELGQLLGRGSFAEVYEGTAVPTGSDEPQKVVLKRYVEKLSPDTPRIAMRNQDTLNLLETPDFPEPQAQSPQGPCPHRPMMEPIPPKMWPDE